MAAGSLQVTEIWPGRGLVERRVEKASCVYKLTLSLDNTECHCELSTPLYEFSKWNLEAEQSL